MCSLILVYQIGELFNQYLAGNTVTNILISKNIPEHLPAITICHDKLFSFEKISELLNSSNLMDKFYNFTSVLRINRLKNGFEKFPNESALFQYQYNSMIEKVMELLKSNLLGYQDTMANLTLPYYNYIDGKKFYSNIHIHIYGEPFDQTSNLTSVFEKTQIEHLYSNKLSPIESIFQRGDDNRKCFTFFNSLQAEYSNIKFIIKEIELIFTFHLNWSPYPITKLHLSIHSPYEMANLDSFVEIPICHQIKVTYNRIYYKQDPLYHNCRYYRNNYNYKNRLDCYYHCFVISIHEMCLPYDYIIYLIDYPVPIEFLPKEYPKLNCSGQISNIDILYSAIQNCTRLCQDE